MCEYVCQRQAPHHLGLLFVSLIAWCKKAVPEPPGPSFEAAMPIARRQHLTHSTVVVSMGLLGNLTDTPSSVLRSYSGVDLWFLGFVGTMSSSQCPHESCHCFRAFINVTISRMLEHLPA